MSHPTIFCFVNDPDPTEGPRSDVLVCALAEDGTFLAHHVSSCVDWAKRDIGFAGGSTNKHAQYAAHYPDGYRLEWVNNPKTHERFQIANRKHIDEATRHAGREPKDGGAP